MVKGLSGETPWRPAKIVMSQPGSVIAMLDHAEDRRPPYVFDVVSAQCHHDASF